MDRYLPIRDLFAREILDAGGRPAVEVELLADEDVVGAASVSLTDPERCAGRTESSREKSLSRKNAGDDSATCAVENINCCIAQELIGTNIFDQAEIDRILTRTGGTADGHGTGGPVTLAVSAAAARTAAGALNIPLYRYLGGTQAAGMPLPVVDMITGGPHVRNMPDFRGFMIVPPTGETFREQLRICIRVHHEVEDILRSRGMGNIQEERNDIQAGIRDAQEALCLIRSAAERAGRHVGGDLRIALDIGAPALYDIQEKAYLFSSEGRKRGGTVLRTTGEMTEYYRELVSQFPVSLIEDPFAPGDTKGWKNLSDSLPDRVRIISENLISADAGRPESGESRSGAVRIDVGRTGTLTDAFEQIKKVREMGAMVEIAHMGNRTADTLASDVAVASGAGYIRGGSLCGMEHVEIYNRLLKIEEQFPF